MLFIFTVKVIVYQFWDVQLPSVGVLLPVWDKIRLTNSAKFLLENRNIYYNKGELF